MDDELMTALDEFLRQHEPGLIDLRRTLHRHPEIGWSEHRTSALVASMLQDAGLEPARRHGTALVYDLYVGEQGSTRGHTVAVRAEMDAVAVQDDKDVEYRSEVPGVCHACGHDAHTAILVGFARAIARLSRLLPSGHVRLIFQPAEEQMPGGGQYLTELGVMDGVNLVYGLHCDPALSVGTVGVRSGPMTWGCDTVQVTLRGPGGHTARPHLTVDLVRVLADVALRLPEALASRDGSPDPVTLVFGGIHAGGMPNVIPSTAELLGTVRSSTHAAWQAAGGWLQDSLRQLTESFGTEGEVRLMRGSPPVENDPAATDLLATAAQRVLGPASVVTVPQARGADDFAWYLGAVPGSYGRLGVRRPAATMAPDLHTTRFDIDEGVVGVGVRVLVSVLFDALSQS